MDIILKLKVTMNQMKTKKLHFGYVCRFVTRALTLRPRNTYIYVILIFTWKERHLVLFASIEHCSAKKELKSSAFCRKSVIKLPDFFYYSQNFLKWTNRL